MLLVHLDWPRCYTTRRACFYTGYAPTHLGTPDRHFVTGVTAVTDVARGQASSRTASRGISTLLPSVTTRGNSVTLARARPRHTVYIQYYELDRRAVPPSLCLRGGYT
jgi:hypothetical protein